MVELLQVVLEVRKGEAWRIVVRDGNGATIGQVRFDEAVEVRQSGGKSEPRRS